MGSSDTDRDPKTFKVLQSQQLLCSGCGQCSSHSPFFLEAGGGSCPRVTFLRER